MQTPTYSHLGFYCLKRHQIQHDHQISMKLALWDSESTLKSLNERYAELQRRSKELDMTRDTLRQVMLKFLRFIVLETQEKKREIEHFNEKLLLQTVYSNDLEQIYQNMNHLIHVIDHSIFKMYIR